MAYGPDTDILLSRIRDIKDDGILNISDLKITNLPELPKNLKRLWCSNIHITTLPKLPNSLKILDCSGTKIKELPELPKTLKFLYCYHTKIKELPKLPKLLRQLYCFSTQITELPELPKSLFWLDCSKMPLIIQRNPGESIQDYNARWNIWRVEQAYKAKCKVMSDIIKDELCYLLQY